MFNTTGKGQPRMKQKKLTRRMKKERNKAGKESVASKYALKKKLQRRGTYSPNSPFYDRGGDSA